MRCFWAWRFGSGGGGLPVVHTYAILGYMKNKHLLGHIAALGTICVWGFAYVAIVILLRAFTPVEILLFRFTLAAAALYIIYPKSMGKTTWRQELHFAGAGLAGVTLYFLMQDFALLNTTASNVGVIVAVAPVFTALLSWRLLRDSRPAGTFFLGAVIALGGLGLVSFAGNRVELNPLGDFLAVFAALCWAVYCVITKKINGFGFHIIQTTRRIFLYGLLFLIPALLAMDFRLGLERFTEPQNVASFLFLGLGASAACFVFWNFSVQQLGPAKTSVYIYLVPLVTVTASVLLLGESVGLLKGIGIVFALAGLVISNRRGAAQKKACNFEEGMLL